MNKLVSKLSVFYLAYTSILLLRVTSVSGYHLPLNSKCSNLRFVGTVLSVDENGLFTFSMRSIFTAVPRITKPLYVCIYFLTYKDMDAY